ncbi:MAG TPA: DNA alkylation repair protein [Micromonosporaceae bacterium]|jgi:3-methyladenine DNA glycosylase AlkD
MAPTPLATTVVGRLTDTYGAARDPERAAPMVAYMRHQFAYLGIGAPEQRVLSRTVVAGLPSPTAADLRDIALACWALDEREYQYFAARLLRRHVRACSAGFLDTVRVLITTKPWWDTVDELAVHVVGPLVARFGDLATTMDAWSADADMWLVRTAILHQLRYRDKTDSERLFRYSASQAGHRDFFVRKAIGWALREYAKTDAEAVRAFVDAHRESLSGLSIREALRNVAPAPERAPRHIG